MAKKPFVVKLLLALTLLCGNAFGAGDKIKLTPDHPDRYVVMRGDTLWDISARFLEDPWIWPQIWHINPEISNPHLIYPGDIIRLEWVDGQPVLKLERPGSGISGNAGGLRTVKLSPTTRTTQLDSAIPTIPMDAISQFLKYPRIVDQTALTDSPYVIASSEDRLISGPGNKVYARGIKDEGITRYDIVRRGQVYLNPENRKDVLGYEAIHIGFATVTRGGDPATLVIDTSEREVLPGDRLLPLAEDEINQYFLPRPPETAVEGRILSVLDGLARVGRLQVVAISQGANEGLESGHVLAVYQTGELVRDNFATQRSERTVRLPNERTGTLMLIRVFDRVSYALVMEAERDLRVMDTVTPP
ncbi:MAG: LysM peptidoglycan-binding domain-containing protein [Chromatiales bacterium]|jgi:hypothetical protein|nr:LysM peptidoglycan-binding domain-containing protein [Chromatiales bacterium]